MRITVLFFGATADAAGCRRTEIEVEAGTASGDVVRTIAGQIPALAGKKLIFAVNEEYRSPDAPLSDFDELAIFTAVSGG